MTSTHCYGCYYEQPSLLLLFREIMASSVPDEEFDNFLFKVNQVSDIVGKLASSDENLQRIGDLEAKHYLGEVNSVAGQVSDSDSVNLSVRYDRTVINRKALLQNDNPETQSQEAFMSAMSEDADRRYRDKQIRKERMETLKKQGNLAFKRGEYEKSLSLYTKALDLIKDSCQLYLNRALTLMHLKLYTKARDDLIWALRLNEDSLKARLLLAKVYYYDGDDFRDVIDEAKKRHPTDTELIDDYVMNFSSY